MPQTDPTAAAQLRLRLDCRHYRGDRPCAAGIPRACPDECGEYAAKGARILIIKLGALGDVIRTAALLPGLKEIWARSEITWVTLPSGVRMLANHPLIDRLLTFDAETILRLECERFDIAICLDKEPGPAALITRVAAASKMGIGLSEHGTVFPLNPECAAYFELGLDNQRKFHVSRKSYPQLIYEALGLRYAGQRYELYPSAHERQFAETYLRQIGVTRRPLIGLNTGAGRAFANKNWPPEKFAQLARRLMRESHAYVALLGGPAEREINAALARRVSGLIDCGCDHSEPRFAALLEHFTAVVTGDTMALHAAIAMGTPVVALFGPTCEQEIDLFGRGEKIVTGLSCAPCYRRACDLSPNCMDDIDIDAVCGAVMRCFWATTISRDATRQAPNSSIRLPVVQGDPIAALPVGV
ncbi:MAG: glycosyltransferase family 9 protein [Phycisphaerae bacterium]